MGSPAGLGWAGAEGASLPPGTSCVRARDGGPGSSPGIGKRRNPSSGSSRLPRTAAWTPRTAPSGGTFRSAPLHAPPKCSRGNAPSPKQLSPSTGRTGNREGTSNCLASHPVTVATPVGGTRRSNRIPRPLSGLSRGGDPDQLGISEGLPGPASCCPGQAEPCAASRAPARRGGERQPGPDRGLELRFEGRGSG